VSKAGSRIISAIREAKEQAEFDRVEEQVWQIVGLRS
jgi:hypothetical protein